MRTASSSDIPVARAVALQRGAEREQLRAAAPEPGHRPHAPPRRHERAAHPAPQDGRADAQRARHLVGPTPCSADASRYARHRQIRRHAVERSARRWSGRARRAVGRAARRACAVAGDAPSRQAADVALDQRVGARQQRLVLGVALDHVGQVAQVVDQELDRTLAPARAPHHAQHVDHHVLELRALEVDRHLERALERHAAAPDLAEVGASAGPAAAPPSPRRTTRSPPSPRSGSDSTMLSTSASAPQWPGLVARHREPEVPHLLGARERLHEGDVERHRLLLELDGGVEHLADGRAPGPLPGRHRRLLSKGRRPVVRSGPMEDVGRQRRSRPRSPTAACSWSSWTSSRGRREDARRRCAPRRSRSASGPGGAPRGRPRRRSHRGIARRPRGTPRRARARRRSRRSDGAGLSRRRGCPRDAATTPRSRALLPRGLRRSRASVAAPPPLFHAVVWLRRGRPRPADEVAADVVAAARRGLAADDDALAPGVDPELPGRAARQSSPPAATPVSCASTPARAAARRVPRSATRGEHARPRAPSPGAVRRRAARRRSTRTSWAKSALDHPRYRESSWSRRSARRASWRAPPRRPRHQLDAAGASRRHPWRPPATDPAPASLIPPAVPRAATRSPQLRIRLEPLLDRAQCVDHRRVIAAAELRADRPQRRVGVAAAEVHRDLARQRHARRPAARRSSSRVTW